MVAGGALVE